MTTKLIIDSEHKINKDSFNLGTLKTLYEKKGFDSKSGDPLDFIDAKKYMLRYLFPCEGGILLNANSKILFKTHDIMNRTYFKRLDKKLVEWFNHSTDTIYQRVCKPGRQLVVEDTINIVGAFKHDNDSTYDKCSDKAKQGVQMMLDFINVVWCSEDKAQYEYIINWVSNMVKGGKNQSLLYAKSHTQGIGKSTLTEFLMNHVIGRTLSIQSSASVLTTPNNYCLFGKLFVVFEELSSNKSEWAKMASTLCEWVTSDIVRYSEKYMIGFDGTHINNYIVNTNTEAIKNSAGRRYFICDLSTKYKGDHDYWNKLHNICFNDEVGKAFYLYMCERDLTGYNSACYPMTSKKKESISALLSPVHKFIKFNYLLCDKEIKRVSTKDMYNHFVLYCNNTESFKFTKRKFNDHMKEIGFNYKISNSKTFWNITSEELEEVAKVRNWRSELDSDDQEEHTIWDDYKTCGEVAGNNNSMFVAKEYEDIIDEKQKVIDEQKKQIDDLKKQLEALKPKKVVKKKDKSKPKKVVKKKEKVVKKKEKVVKKKRSPKIQIGDSNDALSAFLDM